MSTTSRSFPSRVLRILFFWPIRLMWRVATATSNALGIVFTLILAVALIGAGYVLISSFFGIFFGIPLMIIGAFLLARALY